MFELKCRAETYFLKWVVVYTKVDNRMLSLFPVID